ncbi:hypothetical protein [Acidihalobacter ferrooxydans]|nr:hypothetical protein [Acidihalobacter ferrooxydans]
MKYTLSEASKSVLRMLARKDPVQAGEIFDGLEYTGPDQIHFFLALAQEQGTFVPSARRTWAVPAHLLNQIASH